MRSLWVRIEIVWSWLLRSLRIKKDASVIPKGAYCYTIDEGKGIINGEIPIKACKYYRSMKSESACTYVGFIGWDPCLNDQCKICGENEGLE